MHVKLLNDQKSDNLIINIILSVMSFFFKDPENILYIIQLTVSLKANMSITSSASTLKDNVRLMFNPDWTLNEAYN